MEACGPQAACWTGRVTRRVTLGMTRRMTRRIMHGMTRRMTRRVTLGMTRWLRAGHAWDDTSGHTWDGTLTGGRYESVPEAAWLAPQGARPPAGVPAQLRRPRAPRTFSTWHCAIAMLSRRGRVDVRSVPLERAGSVQRWMPGSLDRGLRRMTPWTDATMTSPPWWFRGGLPPAGPSVDLCGSPTALLLSLPSPFAWVQIRDADNNH